MQSNIIKMHDVILIARLYIVFGNEIYMYILQRMHCISSASLQRYVFTQLLVHIHSMAAEEQNYLTRLKGGYLRTFTLFVRELAPMYSYKYVYIEPANFLTNENFNRRRPHRLQHRAYEPFSIIAGSSHSIH